jgi:hypothetical protein
MICFRDAKEIHKTFFNKWEKAHKIEPHELAVVAPCDRDEQRDGPGSRRLLEEESARHRAIADAIGPAQ